MDEFDIPIFRKAYDLYKAFHGLRDSIPKQDRHTVWQRCETIILELLEGIFRASQAYGAEKLTPLKEASLQLNFLRIFVRLMKDVKTIDSKQYVALQSQVDEVGRMLGGWIKSTKERS